MSDIIIETYRSADGSYRHERRDETKKNKTSSRRRHDDEKPKTLVVAKDVNVDVEATSPYEVSDKSLGKKIDIMV